MANESVRIQKLTLIKDNLNKVFEDVVDEDQTNKGTVKIKKLPSEILAVFTKVENSLHPDTTYTQKWSKHISPDSYYNTKLLLIKKNLTSACIRLKRIVKNKTFTEKNWKSINALLNEMHEQINEFSNEVNKEIKKMRGRNKKSR